MKYIISYSCGLIWRELRKEKKGLRNGTIDRISFCPRYPLSSLTSSLSFLWSPDKKMEERKSIFIWLHKPYQELEWETSLLKVLLKVKPIRTSLVKKGQRAKDRKTMGRSHCQQEDLAFNRRKIDHLCTAPLPNLGSTPHIVSFLKRWITLWKVRCTLSYHSYDYSFHQQAPWWQEHPVRAETTEYLLNTCTKNALSKYLLNEYSRKEWFGRLRKFHMGCHLFILKTKKQIFILIWLTGFFCALQGFTIFVFYYRIHIHNIFSFRLQIFQYCATFQSAHIKL